MEMSFEETSFEWEFLHPKGPVAVLQQDLELNSFTSRHQFPELDEEMVDESVGAEEDISVEDEELVDEKLSMDEVAAADEDISFVTEEDCFDWNLQSLLFKEEEEEVGEMVQLADPEICVKDGGKAFGLKMLLKSALMAAAALSIFILGGGRMQFTESNKRIHDSANKKEEVKVVASSPSSQSGHCDERF